MTTDSATDDERVAADKVREAIREAFKEVAIACGYFEPQAAGVTHEWPVPSK